MKTLREQNLNQEKLKKMQVMVVKRTMQMTNKVKIWMKPGMLMILLDLLKKSQ